MRCVFVTATAALLLAAPASAASGNGRIAYSGGGTVSSISPAGGSAADLHSGTQPAFSPDGTKIAFFEPGPADDFVIEVANADGSGARGLGRTAAPRPLAWSPDGTRLAFVAGTSEADARIAVVRSDGTGVATVADDASLVGPPSWSPDGTRLAYTTRNAADIAVANADGSGARKLVDDQVQDAAPAWSPDGSQIAFFRAAPFALVLYLIHRDGSGLRQLGSTSGAVNTSPFVPGFAPAAWSPDGTRLAYTSIVPFSSYRYGTTYKEDVYSLAADGSSDRRLTTSSALGSGFSSVWSPDGTRIAFVSSRGESHLQQLFQMNSDGSCETQITSGPNGASSPTWQAAAAPAAPPLRCAALRIEGFVDLMYDRAYVDANRIYVYTATVRNHGNVASDPIHVRVSSDDAISFLAVKGAEDCAVGAEVNCALPALTPGASVTFELRYRVVDRGGHTLRAVVSGAGTSPDGDESDNVDVQTRAYPFCVLIVEDGGVTLRGSAEDEMFCGTSGPDRIDADGGNDWVLAGGRHDVVHAGSGRDEIFGGTGSDYLYGQAGRDRIHGDAGADVLFAGDGFDRLFGAEGGDYLNGGFGGDLIDAGYGDDRIDSRDGFRDQVFCSGGKDTVRADLRDVLHDCEKITRERAAQTLAPR
jgi:Tol biopolymer transport system component